MQDNVPITSEPWAELLTLLALIRQHAYSTMPSADALIRIRDAIRQFDGEFADQE